MRVVNPQEQVIIDTLYSLVNTLGQEPELYSINYDDNLVWVSFHYYYDFDGKSRKDVYRKNQSFAAVSGVAWGGVNIAYEKRSSFIELMFVRDGNYEIDFGLLGEKLNIKLVNKLLIYSRTEIKVVEAQPRGECTTRHTICDDSRTITVAAT